MRLSGIKTLPIVGAALLAAALLAPPATAQAGSVTFNSDTTIDCASTTWENYAVTVDGSLPGGAALTVDCAHTFFSLDVINGGVVTHTAGEAGGCDLTITTDVTVDAASSISVGARGHSPGTGPGAPAPALGAGPGGTYGGAGAGTSDRPGPEGLGYGSFSNPTDLGSGGGNATPPYLGGYGGGFLHLNVGGMLLVDGTISANGGAAAYVYTSWVNSGGGGSGGSLLIQCSTLTGWGLITADGGAAWGRDTGDIGGNGGGGRISITFDTIGLPLSNIHAVGGNNRGINIGGAGTVFLKSRLQPNGDLIIDNLGRNGAGTEFSGTVTIDNFTTRNYAKVVYPQGENGLRIDVFGDLSVETNSWLHADRRGYGPANGPGAPPPGSGAAPGGTYGGGGAGTSDRPRPDGLSYGSFSNPTDLGSGGGNATSPYLGGYGGGFLHLNVGGMLLVDGTISANGGAAAYVYTSWVNSGGGGSGGSLLIQCSTLTGWGLITANGGAAWGRDTGDIGGNGGGGRISITYDTLTFPLGSIHAVGGSNRGVNIGGAGTVFLKSRLQPKGDLIIDNLGRDGAGTEFSGTVIVDNLTTRGYGKLIPTPGALGFHLDVQDLMTIEANSWVHADAKGYGPANGPGAPAPSLGGPGAGAGFGGLGGKSAANLAGGLMYGSLQNPIDLGSGGGNGTPPFTGGWGGGAIKITVGNVLHIDGTLSSLGGSAAYTYTSGINGGGGGSGGSLLVTCGRLEGFGVISVNGGRGYGRDNTQTGGGGGGGRIAIHTTDRAGYIGVITAAGGYASGYATYGHDGTIFFSDGPGYSLGVENLVAGQSATVDVFGGTPGTKQYLTYSLTGLGLYNVPQLGVDLGLDNPSLLDSAVANAGGQATWFIPVPPQVAGLVIYLQACEIGRTTNIEGAVIQ